MAEEQKTYLEEILLPFLPLDLRVKAGLVSLSETSEKSLDRAVKIVDEAEKVNTVVPDSTANLARFGHVVQEILRNPSNFLTKKSVRRLSQRKGTHIFEIIQWDQRLVEAELKKSKKSKARSKNDVSLLLELKQDIRNLCIASGSQFFDKELIFSQIEEKVNWLFEVFCSHLSEVHEHLRHGRALFVEVKTTREKLAEFTRTKEEGLRLINDLSDEVETLKSNIERLWKKFLDTQSGNLYQLKDREIRQLLRESPLREYHEIIKDLISTFSTFVEKQDIKIDSTSRELLQNLAKSMIVPFMGFVDNFAKLVDFYLLYVDGVFGKKLKKKAEYSNRKFLLDSPGWRAWAHVLEVASDLDQLKVQSEYRDLEARIGPMGSKKSDIEKRLLELNEKEKFLKTTIDDIRVQEVSLAAQFLKWLEDKNVAKVG